MNAMVNWLGQRLAAILSKPSGSYRSTALTHPDLLARTLRPGDVILVDGSTRASGFIKYLTQSIWSHAALFVGPLPGTEDAGGEAHQIVEADMARGVVSSPVSRYADTHVRICRPVGLSAEEIAAVTAFARSRIGYAYDLGNIFDLFRYFMPLFLIPARFRRRVIAFGHGDPTRAICSTMIAEAFQQIGYPILPEIEHVKKIIAASDGAIPESVLIGEILHIRDHKLYVPRDFDISPYFAIVKPEIEGEFDFRSLTWAP